MSIIAGVFCLVLMIIFLLVSTGPVSSAPTVEGGPPTPGGTGISVMGCVFVLIAGLAGIFILLMVLTGG